MGTNKPTKHQQAGALARALGNLSTPYTKDSGRIQDLATTMANRLSATALRDLIGLLEIAGPGSSWEQGRD